MKVQIGYGEWCRQERVWGNKIANYYFLKIRDLMQMVSPKSL